MRRRAAHRVEAWGLAIAFGIIPVTAQGQESATSHVDDSTASLALAGVAGAGVGFVAGGLVGIGVGRAFPG